MVVEAGKGCGGWDGDECSVGCEREPMATSETRPSPSPSPSLSLLQGCPPVRLGGRWESLLPRRLSRLLSRSPGPPSSLRPHRNPLPPPLATSLSTHPSSTPLPRSPPRHPPPLFLSLCLSPNTRAPSLSLTHSLSLPLSLFRSLSLTLSLLSLSHSLGSPSTLVHPSLSLSLNH